ncbi:MAG: hypothetical protein R3Y53_10710 [Bacillota bacterium]
MKRKENKRKKERKEKKTLVFADFLTAEEYSGGEAALHSKVS